MTRIELRHATSNFLGPSGFDRFISRVVEALDDGTCEFSALRYGERQRLFEEFRSFPAHTVILPRKGIIWKIVWLRRLWLRRRGVAAKILSLRGWVGRNRVQPSGHLIYIDGSQQNTADTSSER